MRSFFKSIWREIPVALNLALILSIVFVILMKFWWSRIPELFNGGYELGQIMENVFMSVITGYIFYFIVSFLPYRKEQEDLKEVISVGIEKIYSPVYTIAQEINRISGEKFTIPPTDEQLSKAFDLISNSNPPLFADAVSKQNFTWFDFFLAQKRKTIIEINKLLLHSRFLKSDLVKLVARIENSQFFFWVETSAMLQNRNMDVKFMKENFIECFKLSSELFKFHFENFPDSFTTETREIYKKSLIKPLTKEEVEKLPSKAK